ncbi:hypothetical protein DL93DRAFT_2070546 [Clavulina sp. PMI_390]|nr:hypothetical protein DL93DRAFT_2070546 [Clavulina sp. PMI_390]
MLLGFCQFMAGSDCLYTLKSSVPSPKKPRAAYGTEIGETSGPYLTIGRFAVTASVICPIGDCFSAPLPTSWRMFFSSCQAKPLTPKPGGGVPYEKAPQESPDINLPFRLNFGRMYGSTSRHLGEAIVFYSIYWVLPWSRAGNQRLTASDIDVLKLEPFVSILLSPCF